MEFEWGWNNDFRIATFIHSWTNIYSAYCVPGIVLGAAVTLESKTEMVATLMEHVNYSESWGGEHTLTL